MIREEFASTVAEFSRQFDAKKIQARCLCGEERGLPLMKRDRYGLQIVPVFCSKCGHVYARYRLDSSDLRQFYATVYRTLYSGGATLKSGAKAAAKSRAAKDVIFPAFQSLFPKEQNRKIVEWGSSAGWNLLPFRDAGIETRGFDYDVDYVEYGRKQFGLDLRVLEDSVDPLEGVKGTIDFLILNHVLEHTDDPVSVLRRMSSILTVDGAIFVGLPFLEHIPRWGFKGFFHIGHLHYFSIPYFVGLASRQGFEVVRTNRTHGYVLLKRGTTVEATSPDCRIHNAALLCRYGLPYLVFSAPVRAVWHQVKKVPWLAQRLRRLRNVIHQ